MNRFESSRFSATQRSSKTQKLKLKEKANRELEASNEHYNARCSTSSAAQQGPSMNYAAASGKFLSRCKRPGEPSIMLLINYRWLIVIRKKLKKLTTFHLLLGRLKRAIQLGTRFGTHSKCSGLHLEFNAHFGTLLIPNIGLSLVNKPNRLNGVV